MEVFAENAELDDKVFEIIGNGNRENGIKIINAIAKRLKEARFKHPVYAESKLMALFVINSEWNEFKYAVRNENQSRQKDEGLDVIATMIRFFNREHTIQR